jgi:hypothetical protein
VYRSVVLIVFALTQAALQPANGEPAPQVLASDSTDHLRPVNVSAELGEFDGSKAIKLQIAPGVKPGSNAIDTATFALIEGTEDFANGSIEATLESDLSPNALPAARGFVGLAFRIARDQRHFEAIYLRPFNGRADDQVRRNHSIQYMSFPDYDFAPLRVSDPGKYESYVDIGPREWIRVRIDVDGAQARLFVNDARQPALIVNDLKMGPNATGAVGLWIYNGTIAHFRDVRIVRR